MHTQKQQILIVLCLSMFFSLELMCCWISLKANRSSVPSVHVWILCLSCWLQEEFASYGEQVWRAKNKYWNLKLSGALCHSEFKLKLKRFFSNESVKNNEIDCITEQQGGHIHSLFRSSWSGSSVFVLLWLIGKLIHHLSRTNLVK